MVDEAELREEGLGGKVLPHLSQREVQWVANKEGDGTNKGSCSIVVYTVTKVLR